MNNTYSNNMQRYLSKIAIVFIACIFMVTLVACENAKVEGSSETLSQNVSTIDLSSNENNDLSSEDTASENSDVISTDSQETSSNIEVSDNSIETPLVITDINEIEKLGFNKKDDNYRLIKAFLDGDTTAMEKIIFFEAGVYDSYKTLKIGEYSIRLGENRRLIFSFNVIESGLDTLPVGEHTFIADWGYFSLNNENLVEQTPAQKALYRWHVLYRSDCGIYDFSNPESLVDYEKEIYLSSLSNYIIMTHGELTLQEFQQYAFKITGNSNIQPTDLDIYENGKYGIFARGGVSLSHKYIDEKEENGITTVTIQFYADWAETIKSHVIEYKLKNIDGDWVFISSNFVYKSQYEPAGW